MAWIGVLSQFPWDQFVTLTFDPRHRDVDRDRAEAEAQWWLGVVSHIVRHDLAWTFTTERHESGKWHVHVLVIGLRSEDVTLAKWIWERRHGKARVARVTDIEGVSSYITKYSYATNDIWVSDMAGRPPQAAARPTPESPETGTGEGEAPDNPALADQRVAPATVAAASSRDTARPKPRPSSARTSSVHREHRRVAGRVDGHAGAGVVQLGTDEGAAGERAPGTSRVCRGCGGQFHPRRPNQWCCAARCRARLSHAKHDEALRLVLAAITRGDLEDAASRLGEVLGGR